MLLTLSFLCNPSRPKSLHWPQLGDQYYKIKGSTYSRVFNVDATGTAKHNPLRWWIVDGTNTVDHAQEAVAFGQSRKKASHRRALRKIREWLAENNQLYKDLERVREGRAATLLHDGDGCDDSDSSSESESGDDSSASSNVGESSASEDADSSDDSRSSGEGSASASDSESSANRSSYSSSPPPESGGESSPSSAASSPSSAVCSARSSNRGDSDDDGDEVSSDSDGEDSDDSGAGNIRRDLPQPEQMSFSFGYRQSAPEVAAVLDASEDASERLLILPCGKRAVKIWPMSRLWEPTQFVVLFPRGFLGWPHPDYKDVTLAQYIRMLTVRRSLFSSTSVGQAWCVDQFCRHEDKAIEHRRKCQKEHRETSDADDLPDDTCYLNRTFRKSLAYFSSKLQDVLTLTARFGQPSWFITLLRPGDGSFPWTPWNTGRGRTQAQEWGGNIGVNSSGQRDLQ